MEIRAFLPIHSKHLCQLNFAWFSPHISEVSRIVTPAPDHPSAAGETR